MSEPIKWIGPHKTAWDALNETRKAVAEIIGADPQTWPEHGNASVAIAASVASMVLRANPTPPGSADALIKALSAAQSALLSFAHGNASEEFAKDMADNCAKAIDAFRAENKT